MFISQPMPADDAMLAIAPPSTMLGITRLGEVTQPAEVHEHHVEVRERVGQARAVEQRVHDLADLGDRGVDLVGLAQVGLGEAREAGEVGLLDVDRVHLGAELHEQLRRWPRPSPRPRRSRSPACPRTRARPSSLPPRLALRRRSLLDRDRLFRAVVGAHAAPAPRARRRLLLEHDAVAELVGAEHVGREHVTTTVADTEVGIDANCHHGRAERIREHRLRGSDPLRLVSRSRAGRRVLTP